MKHPLFQNKLRLVVWWLTWLVLSLGQLLLYYIVYDRNINYSIADIALSFLIYSGIGIAIWYPFRYFNSRTVNSFILVTNILLLGAAVIVSWIVLSKYLLDIIIPDSSEMELYWEATLPYRAGSGTLIFGLIILTYYLIMSMSALAEKKAREAKLEAVIRDTELRMLRSQINPHFLFNTLNSISSLTVTDPEKARLMVIKLSDFMRYSLARKDEQPVTLESELNNIRLYLDIEIVRFGDRLQYEEMIEKECLKIKIPVLLLQPLYENAVKHGVHESTGTIKITTRITCGVKYVRIDISNNYETDSVNARGTGTGLANVSKRLDLYYGGNASINVSRENNLFRVVLNLPIE
ncbi:MAG: histidine kinase [Bacteroidales bacterium]|nr:histidine kinase [Bacteroidales bacterium]